MGLEQLAHKVRPCSWDEPLTTVAEAVRSSPHGMVAVVEEGEVKGVIMEEDLPGPLEGHNLRACDLMRLPRVILKSSTNIVEAEEELRLWGLRAAPVVDEEGRYLGFVGRADLTSLRLGVLRPRMVGGMATPLGVYLTTGLVSAGASHWGLVLTGVSLGVIQILSVLLALGLVYLVSLVTGRPFFASALSSSVAMAHFMGWMRHVFFTLEILSFLLLLRLSPLAGYHGAEHQVVHAIERGEPLELERVKRMPRAHRRCGTNLVALFVVASIAGTVMEPIWAVLLALLAWRFLGGPIQWLFTTRPPSKKQLLSAIRAGEELIRRHRERLGERPSLPLRIWNMGLFQVLFGLALIFLLAWAAKLHSFLFFNP